MTSAAHWCCCNPFSCEDWLECEVIEPWYFDAWARHRIEYYQDGILTSYKEEYMEITRAEMVWDPVYLFYVCIGGNFNYYCEDKGKSYSCGNYWSPTRPCVGCGPDWCSRTTTSASIDPAGFITLQCYDPCNAGPCNNDFPTNTIFINIPYAPSVTEYEKYQDNCCLPGTPIGIDGPYDSTFAFKSTFFGRPGCFLPVPQGGQKKTFNEWSYEPWALCNYEAPSPNYLGNVGTGFITLNTFGTPTSAGTICSGGYLFPYQCVQPPYPQNCPLTTIYNLYPNFRWEAKSCDYSIVNPYGGICYDAPIPMGNVTLDCYNQHPIPYIPTGNYIKHTLDTFIDTYL